MRVKKYYNKRYSLYEQQKYNGMNFEDIRRKQHDIDNEETILYFNNLFSRYYIEKMVPYMIHDTIIGEWPEEINIEYHLPEYIIEENFPKCH